MVFVIGGFTATEGFSQSSEEATAVQDTVRSEQEQVEEDVNSEKKSKKDKKKNRKSRKERKAEENKNDAEKPQATIESEKTEEPSPIKQESKENKSEVPASGDRTQAYLEEFKKLDVSYIGSTQNCVGYNVYAIKYKRTWFLATNVKDSPVLSVFIEKPPRSEAAFPAASAFVVEGLKGMLVNKYAKKKNRRKKVKDLQLYGFYKLKRPGRQAAKGVLLIEFPKELNKEPDFFVFKFFYDLFNKKKEELKPDPNIKQQFEDKLQVPVDKAKEAVSTAVK